MSLVMDAMGVTLCVFFAYMVWPSLKSTTSAAADMRLGEPSSVKSGTARAAARRAGALAAAFLIGVLALMVTCTRFLASSACDDGDMTNTPAPSAHTIHVAVKRDQPILTPGSVLVAAPAYPGLTIR